MCCDRCGQRDVLNPIITVIPVVVLSFSVWFLTLFCPTTGVERVPRQAGGVSRPAAPLGPRDGEVEIRVRVDQRGLHGSNRSSLLPQGGQSSKKSDFVVTLKKILASVSVYTIIITQVNTSLYDAC